MDTKEQAVMDYDQFRKLIEKGERTAQKLKATGNQLCELRMAVSSVTARKAGLKIIMDGTPETVTGLMNRGKVIEELAADVLIKYPEETPEEVATE